MPSTSSRATGPNPWCVWHLGWTDTPWICWGNCSSLRVKNERVLSKRYYTPILLVYRWRSETLLTVRRMLLGKLVFNVKSNFCSWNETYSILNILGVYAMLFCCHFHLILNKNKLVYKNYKLNIDYIFPNSDQSIFTIPGIRLHNESCSCSKIRIVDDHESSGCSRKSSITEM